MKSILLLALLATFLSVPAFASSCDCLQGDGGLWEAVHQGDNSVVQYFQDMNSCFQWIDTASVCQQ